MMCNKMRWAVIAATLVSFSASARPTLATPTVFFARDNSTAFMTSYPNSLAKYNQFTTSLSSYGVNDIDSAAGFDPTLTFGSTGITAVAHGTLAQSAPGFMIGTQALLETDAALPNPTAVDTTFDFNVPIKSFGLYVIQGGDGANTNVTFFRLKNTVTGAFNDTALPIGPNWGTDNAFFIGFTDTDPFNQVQILETTDLADGMLYDNLVAGGAVPEPASCVLMMFGGAFAFGARSRRS